MLVPIDDNDVPPLVALVNRAYRGGGDAPGWSTEAAYIAGSRTTVELVRSERCDKPAGAYLKWQGQGALDACVWIEPIGDGTWYLGSLAIDPACQNEGLGKPVLAAAERRIAAQGGRRIRMTVIHIRDVLITWYGRRGYAPTGETVPFPYGDERFGTPLRDDLHFVVLEKVLAA